MSSMLRAIRVTRLSFSHFFSLWLPPIFPVTAIEARLLAECLPCWTFEISYVTDLHLQSLCKMCQLSTAEQAPALKMQGWTVSKTASLLAYSASGPGSQHATFCAH